MGGRVYDMYDGQEGYGGYEKYGRRMRKALLRLPASASSSEEPHLPGAPLSQRAGSPGEEQVKSTTGNGMHVVINATADGGYG